MVFLVLEALQITTRFHLMENEHLFYSTKNKVKFGVNDVLGELQTFFSLSLYPLRLTHIANALMRVFPLQAEEKPLFEFLPGEDLHRLLCAPSGRAVAVGRQAREDLEADQAWLEMKRGLGFQQEAIAETRGGGLKRQDESGKNGAEEREGLNKRERERIPGSNSNTLCGRKTEPLNSSFRK